MSEGIGVMVLEIALVTKITFSLFVYVCRELSVVKRFPIIL